MYHPDSLNLTDTEQVDEIMFQAMSAQDEYLHLDQNSIDRIVEHMAKTGASKHLSLAKQAIAETERGILEDKSITNILASSDFVKKLTDIQSVGIIEENEISGYQSIVEPVGVLASFPPSNLSIPSTLFQAILSVKTRNPIVFCFSPSAHSSSESAARLMQKAAQDAGAPNFAIQWLSASSPKTIEALSKHPEINLILMDKTNTLSPATPLHVPVLGTGQINTPCFIDRSADMEQAVTDIIASRHFDNGLIPTSEQTIIISREIYFQCLDLLMQKSCHLVSEQERLDLEELLFDEQTGNSNPECTGRSAVQIAKMAGFVVPKQTKLLISEIGGIGSDYPLSKSNAVPLLSILAAESWYEGLCFCEAVLEFGSSSHTAVLHARDKDLCDEFSSKIHARHIILNQPATRGDICKLAVSTSNGITSADDRYVGNPGTAELSINMLLHHKIVQKTAVRHNEWKMPEKILFAQGCSKHLQTLSGMEHTLIVTEKNLLNTDTIQSLLHNLKNQKHNFFCNTGRVVTVPSIEEGLQSMNTFQPTALLAIGNSNTINTAKAMRYFYQRPEASLPRTSLDFSNTEFSAKCSTDLPQKRVSFISIPTTPNGGLETNGFVTIFDENRKNHQTLHSSELLPEITLIDPDFSTPPEAKDMASTGLSILSHAIEAYVSPLASNYSDSMAEKAIRLIFEYLPDAVKRKQVHTREKIYNAAALAGMAAENAKSGLTRAMVQSLNAEFNIASDSAHSLLLPHVISYNGVEDPSRFNPLMPGSRYIAHERYQELARMLGLDCKSPEQGVESLVKAIISMQKNLHLPSSIHDFSINQAEYQAKIERMAEDVFVNHSSTTNPRPPLIHEIIDIYSILC